MADWGLKVSKPTKAITSTNPYDLLFNSSYQMFKYAGDYSVSTTFNPGDTTKTVSVTHGLGYVPAFIPYVYRGDTSVLEIIPDYTYGTDYDTSIEAYADTDKVYFKVTMGLQTGNGWNEQRIAADEIQNNWFGDSYAIGDYPTQGGQNSAIRFTNVPIASGSSLNNVELQLYVGASGGDEGDRIKWDTYGIDEDNTGSLFDGDPYGRSRTSATEFKNINRGEANNGNTIGINVTSMADEIKSRGGWSENNAMGFTMINNGTDADNWFGGVNAGDSHLRIRFNGNVTFDFRTIVFKDKIYP